jgi:nucleoside-diphosphate-sugar epimerase
MDPATPPAPPTASADGSDSSAGSASGGLSVLVLGGTAWLGHLVARLALARGHAVTCLARGESGPVPSGARHLVADRWAPDAYAALAGEEFDVVLDVCWQPELVRGALAALADSVERWIYVSTCSVYRDEATPGGDEEAAVHDPWQGTGPASLEVYGPAKVACEHAVLATVGGERTLVARPGLIGGYGDPSDRFGYWPARLAAMRAPDEDVLVPELDRPVQAIDAEDLAAWLVTAAEQRLAGVFNTVGTVMPLREVVEACASAVTHSPRFVEASDGWLSAHGVAPWAGVKSLPLWLPRPD